MEVKFSSNEPTRKVRVRMALDGMLNIGDLRTLLFNYLFAK